jgi:hypothetical protein
MISMAQVIERKTGNPMVQGLSTAWDCDGEDGRAVNLDTQGCGFYPYMG